MMWFQRYEEPKTITDDYEQVSSDFLVCKIGISIVLLFRVHTYFSIMNVGKHVNGTISCLNINFWKIVNFEFTLTVHRERVKE